MFLELKISRADRAIIFNSRRIKSSPLPLGEGLGERVNPPPPPPPHRRGANPIRRSTLAKVLPTITDFQAGQPTPQLPLISLLRRTVCRNTTCYHSPYQPSSKEIPSESPSFYTRVSERGRMRAIVDNGSIYSNHHVKYDLYTPNNNNKLIQEEVFSQCVIFAIYGSRPSC